MGESHDEHLLNHLRDVHAVELHTVRQLERAARRRDEETNNLYSEHLERTRAHEQRIGELVEGHGHEPSAVEDKTLRGRAIGLRQLADIALDTPVKLAMNLFALGSLRIAAYELLNEIARATENEDAARVSEEILDELRSQAEETEGTFDHAVDLLKDSDQDDLVLSHLSDMHALERQSQLLLELAVEEVCEDDELTGAYNEHLEETREHERLIGERIEARDAKPSAVKDLHLGAAKAGLNDLVAKPPDAQAKMAMNLFCVEHLEIAGHELLIRLAESDGDSDTAEAARGILEQERAAAQAIREGFGRTVELMLESDGSYEGVRAAERPMEVDSAG